MKQNKYIDVKKRYHCIINTVISACFSINYLANIFKILNDNIFSSDYSSRHNIAEKVLSWRYTTITHSLTLKPL
jgi:hypothetical protein